VPALIKGAHRLLYPRVGLAERAMHRSSKPHRADAIMRRKWPMPGFGQGGTAPAFSQPATPAPVDHYHMHCITLQHIFVWITGTEGFARAYPHGRRACVFGQCLW